MYLTNCAGLICSVAGLLCDPFLLVLCGTIAAVSSLGRWLQDTAELSIPELEMQG